MKRCLLVTACLLVALPAQAHHGVAAVGLSQPEGPGAALETTAAMPLPRRLAFGLIKTEMVSFRTRDDRGAFPEQKDYSVFNMAVLGFGITPWLSAYVFQPYNVKSLDGGPGRNAGLADTNLMLAFGWKWDEGFRLIPAKESIDELEDWHFLLWAACSVPTGSTEKADERGERFAPDMQTGFGEPSPSVGVSALKQLSPDVTLLAEVNYQYFFAHRYSVTRYKFGSETRTNLAGIYRAYGNGRVRLDLVAEAAGLNLQRDREAADASDGTLTALQASGGSILYGSVGVRLYLGRVGLSAGVKRALLKDLNEGSEQQGSEGLERFRLSFAVSASAPL